MRPRTRKEPPSRLSAAVTQLRQALGQTQQQFAQTLGTAVTSIARYETSRNPSGPILVRLKDLTRHLMGYVADDRPEVRRKLCDLEDIFYSALVNEFPTYRLGLVSTLTGESAQCREILVEMLLSESTPLNLRPKLQEAVDHLHELNRQIHMLDPMSATLPEHATAEDIADKFVPLFLEGQYGGPVPKDVSTAAVQKVKRGIAKLKKAERELKT